MLITCVELTNIKSYRHAEIHLGGGTTAIRGHNGAGKSTLVEAIGWALFDALPYSQQQFVREGEKWGQVTVTFVSAEDDREYQVVRRAGSGALWYVYDAELDHRPAEQKADVVDFLRRHLRIEGEISLEALFTDALGVPQGTLTADFLLTPANRKKKFDALLQVEEFTHAVERLRETRSYLQDALHTQEMEIGRLERETQPLDEWRTELAASRARERELVDGLDLTRRRHAEAATRRDTLQAHEREVKRLEAARDLARVAWEGAEATTRQARTHAGEAEESAQICAGALADHQVYLQAEQALAEARRRAQVRDHRVRQRSDLASALASAAREAEYARGHLDDATNAAQRVVDLASLVARQRALISRRDTLQSDVARLNDAQDVLHSRAAEVQQRRAGIAGTQARIAEIERDQGEADELAARRTHLDELKAAQAMRVERERRFAAVARELRDTNAERTKTLLQEEKARTNLARLEDARELAERCPQLEDEHLRLRAEVERLRGAIEQHREGRAQSAEGHCPFLREPCLNIQQRGVQSLAVYFDRALQRDQERLTPLRQQLESLGEELAKARTAAQFYARLEDYRTQHEQEVQRHEQFDERLATLHAEREEITKALGSGGSEQALKASEALVARSEQAALRLGELGPLRERLEADRTSLALTEAEVQRGRELVGKLVSAPDELQAVRESLNELGDPQSESTRAEGIARERPRLEAEVARLESIRQAAAARVAEADEALAPFTGLDAELATLEAQLGTSRPGHTRYLEHKQVADRLPERREALQAAEARLQAAAESYTRTAGAFDQASVGFDPAQLEEATRRVSELHGELSRATEELKNLQARIDEREAAIKRAEGFLDDLRAARTEYGTLGELGQMLQLFREMIKEAGPYVMQAVLRQISTEANRIFGEILGDRSAQLSWQDDYEIVLRSGAQERHFAQLSGGEQMSAALAVRLALLRSLARMDIAFFDEPTQNMDDERRTNLAEQLRRVHGFDQLIVISHDDTFEQGLDSVIHVEKRNGETVLVAEDALVGA